MKGYIAMHWRDPKPEIWWSLSIAPCISISLVLRSCRLMLMLILSRRVSLYPAPYLPPPSPTVARAPSHGLPNPWGQPATLQRSPKADLLSSLPNTQAPTKKI